MSQGRRFTPLVLPKVYRLPTQEIEGGKSEEGLLYSFAPPLQKAEAQERATGGELSMVSFYSGTVQTEPLTKERWDTYVVSTTIYPRKPSSCFAD